MTVQAATQTQAATSSDHATNALRAVGVDTTLIPHLLALMNLATASAPAPTAPQSDSTQAPGGSRSPGNSPRDAQLVAAAQACVDIARWCEGTLLEVCRAMALQSGELILEQWGLCAAELSTSKAQRWRTVTKSAVASELQALSGWGIQSCHDRVGLALTPAPISEPIEMALKQGWNDSRAVIDFWRKARHLDLIDAGIVARASFGPVPDGDGVCQRASHSEFGQRLGKALASVDPDTHRRQRQGALDRRDSLTVVDDDGTGTLTTTGPVSKIAAAALRVDSIARKTRAAGDPRTLGQLRADLSLALLTHGVLPDFDQGLSPASSDLLAEPGPLLRATLGRHSAPIALEVIVPIDVLASAQSASVGVIPGFGSISAPHVRELAQTPGTVIHRLLTDPADGRCIERTATAYRPDKAMLDQLRAMDRSCRGPGCTVDASRCQPDHETPYADGGATSESNLALKHGHHHNNKTLKLWSSELHTDRRITWHTLLGQKYTTRAFDYRALQPLQSLADELPPKRQSLLRPRPTASTASTASTENGTTPVVDRDDAIYQVLTRQWLATGHSSLADSSDAFDSADFSEHITLRHETSGGQRRRGPHPRHIALAERHAVIRRRVGVDGNGATSEPADVNESQSSPKQPGIFATSDSKRSRSVTPDDDPPPF